MYNYNMMKNGIVYGSQDCYLVADRVLLRAEKGKTFGSWLHVGLFERLQRAHGSEKAYLDTFDF